MGRLTKDSGKTSLVECKKARNLPEKVSPKEDKENNGTDKGGLT